MKKIIAILSVVLSISCAFIAKATADVVYPNSMLIYGVAGSPLDNNWYMDFVIYNYTPYSISFDKGNWPHPEMFKNSVIPAGSVLIGAGIDIHADHTNKQSFLSFTMQAQKTGTSGLRVQTDFPNADNNNEYFWDFGLISSQTRVSDSRRPADNQGNGYTPIVITENNGLTYTVLMSRNMDKGDVSQKDTVPTGNRKLILVVTDWTLSDSSHSTPK